MGSTMKFGIRERLIFVAGVRRSFAPDRVPVLCALAVAGILLVVQRGDLPPLIAVSLVALGALDAQFNNLFYQTPTELEALTLLPLPWRGVIFAKNLAALAAMAVTWIMMAMAILFFSPRFPDTGELLDALLYVWTVLFPLLILGNLRSVQEPRSDPRSAGGSILQAVGMVAVVVVCSVPYIIFSTLAEFPPGAVAFGFVGAFFWLRSSIPQTAAEVEQLLVSP